MNELHQIKNENDINELLNAYANFHDACITQINYISGSFVNEVGAMGFGDEKLKILFNSQSVKKTLELTFSNVKKLNLIPLHDAILDYTLRFDGEFILWANFNCFQISDNCTYVVAKNLEWKIL